MEEDEGTPEQVAVADEEEEKEEEETKQDEERQPPTEDDEVKEDGQQQEPAKEHDEEEKEVKEEEEEEKEPSSKDEEKETKEEPEREQEEPEETKEEEPEREKEEPAKEEEVKEEEPAKKEAEAAEEVQKSPDVAARDDNGEEEEEEEEDVIETIPLSSAPEEAGESRKKKDGDAEEKKADGEKPKKRHSSKKGAKKDKSGKKKEKSGGSKSPSPGKAKRGNKSPKAASGEESAEETASSTPTSTPTSPVVSAPPQQNGHTEALNGSDAVEAPEKSASKEIEGSKTDDYLFTHGGSSAFLFADEEVVRITPPTSTVEKSGKKGKKEKKPKRDTVSLWTLFRYTTVLERLMLVVGAFMAVLAGLAQPMFAIIFGTAIDKLSNFNDVASALNGIVVYFVYLAVGAFIATWIEYNAFTYVSQMACNRARERLFQAMMRQDIGWFDSQSSGHLVSRIASDIDQIQEGIGEKIGRFIEGISACVGGFAVGFGYNAKLSGVILSVVPLLAMTGALFGRAVSWAVTRMQTVYAESSALATESFSNVRTVISYGGEANEIGRYEKALEAAGVKSTIKAHATGFGLGSMLLVVYLTYALAFYYGSLLVQDGTLTPGHLLIVLFALVNGTQALGNSADPIASMQTARGAGYYVYTTIDKPFKIDPLSEEGSRDKIDGHIEFKNVRFRYPSRPDAQVLQGLSFKVKPGQTVAFVGPSGCGKSTTISLVERFYDVEEGEVLLDGKNIQQYHLQTLRRHMALVSQEPILFARSIYDNIVLGAHGPVTKEQVEAAAKMANAHDFISRLPDQYNSMLGSRGAKLSGGEKQRIAIARALISNPSILILDEATSALDSQSEKIVQDALDKAQEGRTTLVIAHRLSTIRNADVICVLYEGKLVESGTHEELLKIPDGLYARMVAQQQVDETTGVAKEGRKESENLAENDNEDEKKNAGGPVEVTDSQMELIRKKNPNARNWLRRLFKYALMDPIPLLFSNLFSFFNGGTFVVYAYLYARVLNALFKFLSPVVNTADARHEVNTFCWAFAVFAVGLGLIAYGRVSFMYLSSEKLANRLRQYVFRALVRQEVAYFDQAENSVGTLITKLALEGANLERAAGYSLSTAIMVGGTFISTAIAGFYLCPKLCAAVMASLPVLLVGGFFRMRFMSTAHLRIKKSYEQSGHLATEAVANPRTVASLTCEHVFFADYSKELEYPKKAARRDAVLAGFAFGTANMSMFLIWALAFWYGGQLMGDGECDIVQFFTTSMSLIFSATIVAMLLTGFPDFRRAELSAISTFSVLDRQVKIPTLPATGKKLEKMTGAIEFVDVDFAYPTRQDFQILKKLHLRIEEGKTLAIVGGSGSGKSTIIQLIQRFYDPLDGKVLLDDVPLTELDVVWFRKQIGIVSQEPILFNMSILENIRYGKPDATMEEVVEACQVANIHDFITKQLPEGYNTNTGEMGVQLSGGQKQRVAIARAIIRNPRILLLDEATSALDTRSETVVQKALEKAAKGRTTVVVAHRLKTIVDAHKIAFLEDGRIAELGNHRSLMAKKGKYYDLVKTQAQFK